MISQLNLMVLFIIRVKYECDNPNHPYIFGHVGKEKEIGGEGKTFLFQHCSKFESQRCYGVAMYVSVI